MDLEKIKKNFDWDPEKGDYSKSDVSYERRMQTRKRLRTVVLKILYILILIVSIYLLFKYVK